MSAVSKQACAPRYAKALFLAAETEKALSDVAAVSANLLAALRSTEDMQTYLSNPLIENAAKLKTLTQALKSIKAPAKVQKLMGQFLNVMSENDRLSALSATLQAFQERVDADSGRVTAVVKTVSSLSTAQKKEITAWVKSVESSAKDVNIEEHIDASILAGLEIRVGSKLCDATAAGRLARLKTNLNVSN